MVAQLVNNPPAMQETPVRFLGWEDPLEKGQAPHSSILGLPLWLRWERIHPQCRRLGFNPWVGKIPLEKGKAPHSSILAWRIPQSVRYTTDQLSLTHSHTQRHRHSHRYSDTHTCTHICIHICTQTRKQTYIHTHTYTHTDKCTLTHMLSPTHTHIPRQ